jgi:hypothetical protein
MERRARIVLTLIRQGDDMGYSGKQLAVVLACAAGLAGCGGGGDNDSLDIAVTPDGRVLSGSDAVVASDFVGRTFPLLFARAEDRSPQAVAETGTGSIRVVDNDTIAITLPGQAAKSYMRISATEFSDGMGEGPDLRGFGRRAILLPVGGQPGDRSAGLLRLRDAGCAETRLGQICGEFRQRHLLRPGWGVPVGPGWAREARST